MTCARPELQKQQGAALLIVLVLVASLAFIALSITQKTTLAASRSVNARIRMEAHWYGFGAEALAQSAIAAMWAEDNANHTLDDPLFSDGLEAPLDVGVAKIYLADNTACFNVNSLAGNAAGQTLEPSPEMEELRRLAGYLGLSEFEGARIASVIADWIDENNARLPQGAEDGAYTTKPSPYRTGNTLAGSVSEIRAMEGIDRETYRILKPYLCAHPDDAASPINVNMLTSANAVILAAALGEKVSVLQAQDIIAARPTGGYADVQAFLAEPAVAGLGLGDAIGQRLRVKSEYILARAEIIYDNAVMEMTTQYSAAENGAVNVIARRFGAEE